MRKVNRSGALARASLRMSQPPRGGAGCGADAWLGRFFPGPDVTTRSFGAACARADGPGKAALFSVHKFVGARQVRPRPSLEGPHLERLALAGPIPEPHAL